MDLSVIIVNYNVKYFLEQCLHSVKKAIGELKTEVFVVDNNSVDGSCSHVKEKFPWVKLIENKENVGFSRANNQAIKESTGKYILLLNPDTVVEEDTFLKCFNFMEEHPEGGGLGVKMIDGSGHFLPESKRSLPTPWVAFYKIFGLSRFFPKSKRFGKYHLGYLDRDEINEVEVLSGAYMFMRKKTLDEAGLLDEEYFMYGEDIDLSYRITLEGYKNYYFPDTTIIHYKGESTKKGSLNYVMVFYNAMIIFARKHFSKRNAKIYSSIINFAIYLRAAMAVSKRFVKRIYRQILDFSLIFAGFIIGLPFWENVKGEAGSYYPDEYLKYVVPSYILIWIISAYYSGGYDKPFKFSKYISGILFGTIIILLIYSLLPETLRFSRALILLGTLWTLISTLLLRTLLHTLKIQDYKFDSNKKKRIAIVGELSEAKRVDKLLSDTQIQPEIIGYIYPDSKFPTPYIGSIDQLEEICRIYKLDEILFCSENISSQQIIRTMTRLTNVPVSYKIAPPESLSIIGSNSINTSGDLYTINFASIGKESNRRSKRLFDILSSLCLIITFPLWFIFMPGSLKALSRLLQVFMGSKTMVGYVSQTENNANSLPKIRQGILSPASPLKSAVHNERASKLNILYAKDYRTNTDLIILLKSFRKLGK